MEDRKEYMRNYHRKNKDYFKEYYAKHREEIIENAKMYYKNNKTSIDAKRKADKSSWNQYKDPNYQAKYYELHKEEIKARRRQRYNQNKGGQA